MKPPLQTVAQALQRHPRRLGVALAALLLGTGVTAFGIAPLDGAAPPVPAREIAGPILSVAPTATRAGGESARPFVLYRSDVSRGDDSVQSLLRRLGVNDGQAAAFLRQDASARALLAAAGRQVSAETDERQRLLRLSARWLADDGERFVRLVVERGADDAALHSKLELAPLQRRLRLASGVVRSTLFDATDAAKLPDGVAAQLAELFSDEVDFRHDLRRGDRFHVAYEALEGDGELLGHGKLLGAEFVNSGQRHQVLWFEPADGRGDFYTLEGRSLRRTFLASPLAFSRVSSGYGMRFHPISGREKPHLGVDFSAPTGTPVHSVADGKVAFAGHDKGYGNLVVIEHRDSQSTAYAHLSHIGVRQGQQVAQGERIGAVGSTGSSTGPHLHFEYRVRNQHQDPLTLARKRETQTIPASARAGFNRVAQAMRAQLDAASQLVQASAE